MAARRERSGIGATERFEVRLTASEAKHWRELAAARGANVATLVRRAVAYAARHAPADFIEQLDRDALAATSQGFTERANVRTSDAAETARDGG